MRDIEITTDVYSSPNKDELISIASKFLDLDKKSIKDLVIVKKSIDARGFKILNRYKLNIFLNNEDVVDTYLPAKYKNVTNSKEVIIVGAGPAGLFAALKLIELGLKPIILERGKDVHARKYDIALLNRESLLNDNSNYAFGEGGAGTYSDGKLYTRSVKRGNVYEVLSRLVDGGAEKSIMYEAHPHIGTDKLSNIIENIRKTIISYGGEYYFDTLVTDLLISGDKVIGVKTLKGINYKSNAVILATGHSAKDIYRLFAKNSWDLEAKGFAIGVRAEHSQELINNIRYRGRYSPKLPPAAYSLVAQADNKGVFSFCMCPGGTIVPASTYSQELVLNGMSNSARSSIWANSGIVVSINPNDLKGYQKYGALSLLEFQSQIEREAFNIGGGNLQAPSQRITDFIRNRVSPTLPKSSYFPGLISYDLNEFFPSFIQKPLKTALLQFDKSMKGIVTEDAILLAVESRTSSPVRIVRDKDSGEHIRLKNLYPCGEGSGYSGGIVSSALDGINSANKIYIKLKSKSN